MNFPGKFWKNGDDKQNDPHIFQIKQFINFLENSSKINKILFGLTVLSRISQNTELIQNMNGSTVHRERMFVLFIPNNYCISCISCNSLTFLRCDFRVHRGRIFLLVIQNPSKGFLGSLNGELIRGLYCAGRVQTRNPLLIFPQIYWEKIYF